MSEPKKTPEEIKKGLDCISRHRMEECGLECDKCEAYVPGWTISGICSGALSLIQQFEAKDAQQAQHIAELEKELAAVKRERDKAVRWLIGNCNVCRWAGTEKCDSCDEHEDPWYDDGNSNWEWEGVCPGNTGAQPNE